MLCTERKTGFMATVLIPAALFLLALSLVMLPGCAKPNPDTDPIRDAAVGDVVKFGEYEWRIVEKQDDKALLVSEYIIGGRAYTDKDEPTTWESCALRAYLNGEFYDGFTDNQKAAIAEVENTNPGNVEFGTSGGASTTDRVFLLTPNDATKYFPTDEDRRGVVKLVGPDDWYQDGDNKPWWVRMPGKAQTDAMYVLEDGTISSYGSHAAFNVQGVRPAMWVSF